MQLDYISTTFPTANPLFSALFLHIPPHLTFSPSLSRSLYLRSEPDAVLEGIKMDDDVKKELLKNIERRMTPQPLKMRADIELTCFHYEGIDAIKKALGAGEAAVPDEDDGDEPIKINLVAPPLYVITMTSLEKKRGIEKMTTAIEAIETVIAEYDGSLNVKVAPRSVTERDDKELNVLMEELERANMEVSGDDDVSDDEDGDK
eukprot:TRINITY_DN7590_c0_g2_i3.p1 TRINITY_DN7590_c0_g2~~TRINITY_DN7590_c0_g2_i3.p1  ORF type:complete len:204 (+),score=89.25 TRINITY_DN7590_c0_g2_i3:566-1177(+)